MIKIQANDIIFTFDKGNLFSRAIYFMMSLFQDRKFPELSHVAIVINQDSCIETDFKHGVIKSPLSKYIGKGRYHMSIGRYRSRIPDTRRANIRKYITCRVGAKYSWLQIILIILGKGVSKKFYKNAEKEAYDCSELISEAYSYYGYPIVGGDTSMHTPADLYLSKRLDITKIQ